VTESLTPECIVPPTQYAYELVITVPGDPVPWAAKAVNRKTGNRFISARQAEATGRILAAIERTTNDSFPADIPLLLCCEFYVRRPKYHYGTGKNAGAIKPRYIDARPTGKPDLSNLVKLLEDGLVLGSVVPDDDQVVYLEAQKFFTYRREEQPRSVARLRLAS
jgi:Holliday junction resolvase RusA-like endonuclease